MELVIFAASMPSMARRQRSRLRCKSKSRRRGRTGLCGDCRLSFRPRSAVGSGTPQGFEGAIVLARLRADASAMIAGWRESGRCAASTLPSASTSSSALRRPLHWSSLTRMRDSRCILW